MAIDAARDVQTAHLTQSLNQVLADSYALLSLTHLAHWNVEGQGFFALHTAFQTQYEELFTAVDEIAERVRALIAGNEKVVADAARSRDLAGAASDAESQDLMIGRITLHQKTIWMLKSFLKG